MEPLDHAVKVLKNMAEFLVPYCKNKDDEADVAILKQYYVNVDGYDLIIYYTKEHYFNVNADEGVSEECDLHIVQVQSRSFPFLPFRLLCRIGVKFLGEKELALAELISMGKKVYMWSVAVDVDGNPIPVPEGANVSKCNYEGLEYSHAPSSFTGMQMLSQ